MAMEKQAKETLEKYGKLICDFANGKTTDDALIALHENLQVAFNGLKNLSEDALMRFPPKKIFFAELTETECTLFDNLLKLYDLHRSCDHDLSKSGIYNLEEYHPDDQTFIIRETSYYCGIDVDNPSIECINLEVPVTELKEFLDDVDHINATLAADMEKFSELYDHVETLKQNATNRFSHIEEKAKYYPRIEALHTEVNAIQEELKAVLSEIMQGDGGYESEIFQMILRRYNEIPKSKLIVNDNLKLVEIEPFTSFIVLREFVTFCIFEFLKNQDYSGRERIAICQHCNNFYIKAKLNDRQHYCPTCSRKNKMPAEKKAKYMKDYRANPARKKIIAKKKREEMIQHLIREAGKTRMEAELIADEEV
jgi:hypothetical protein